MIGTEIGDLKLIRALGEGGMGCVYLAEHRLLNDFQAVKVLDPRFTQNQEVVRRFLNEGRAAVKLRHPNLVQIHDVGQLPNDGPWYMVMEYLDGGTLARYMASQGGPLSIYLILHILAPVLSCLQWIHDRDVVHRDLKPDNLFLVQWQDDPHFPKVLDLGVAQVGEAIAAGPGTKDGAIVGTPVYMAPEQLRGERVSPLADIFAIGVVLYEMTTGGWFPWQRMDESRAAYLALTTAELYYRMRSGPPIDPRQRFRAISEGWSRALVRTLDPDSFLRPQSSRELAVLIASNAPGDDLHEQGIEILARRAPELLRSPHDFETVRAPRPPVVAAPAVAGKKLRYQLGAKLGAGGMAEVFEGRLIGAEGFERRVAIKRVLAGLSEISTFVAMFVTEAQIASRLNHINVVSTFDFNRDEEGRLCLVMELVHGRDLATLLESGPIRPSLIIYITGEMLRGLGYAHAPEPDRDGILHRDVSPQNLLLSYEGEVKVSDFGIAKALDASGNAQSSTVRGKPSYMSPEQCNGDRLDGRSDLFAVGTMLYEMLTNAPLFTGTPKEIIAHVLYMEIPPPSKVRAGVPRDLEAITRKLMAREPADRYPDAEAAIADLLRCKDAPRDGRGELVQVLAERFPDSALRTRIGGPGKPGSGRASRPAAVPQRTVTVPSTLAGAASQSVSLRRPWRARRLVVVTGAGLLIACFVTIVALARREPHDQVSSRVEQTAVMSDARVAEPVARPSAPDAAIAAAPPGEQVSTPPRTGAAAASPAPQARVVVAAPRDVPTDAGVSLGGVAHGARQDAGGSPEVAHKPAAVAARREPGQLVISVKPWALIFLNGKPAGQTPFNEKLPAGRYRIRITNAELGKDETIAVTVSPDAPATLQRTW
jgi:eukaryotic-like serine/threonine-protein kinase